jgi:hypothetical protein
MSDLRRSDRKRTQTQFTQATQALQVRTQESERAASRRREAAVASAYGGLVGLKQLGAAGGGEGSVWVGAYDSPALGGLRRFPPTASASWTLYRSTEPPIRCAGVPRAGGGCASLRRHALVQLPGARQGPQGWQAPRVRGHRAPQRPLHWLPRLHCVR